ncbi:MAG TPA: hypothetical protein VEA99_12170, partial [Gemmatimonadaceae bacterium]|nr:hypothetical protein [Gemmatimonadaceae bacterium]
MIGALALAPSLVLGVWMQLSPARPASITIKDAQRQATVALVAGPLGPALRPEQLAPIFDVSVRRTGGDRFVVRSGGVEIQMALGLPFARVGEDSRQLVSPP